MTEHEWATGTDPGAILLFLRGRVSRRKFRRFAVECCRRIEDRFYDPRVAQLLDWAEAEAEGAATPAERGRVDAWMGEQALVADTWGLIDVPDERRVEALRRNPHLPTKNLQAWSAIRALYDWDQGTFWDHAGEHPVDVANAAGFVARSAAGATGHRAREEREQVVIAHELFGNPFRPAVFPWSCRTPTVVSLAQGIYAERTFDRLPILADALQDAGCENEEVLSHCRSDGPHVRGCWVVDLLLGKE